MRLELKHVWRSYRVGDEDVVALRDASVTFERGEFVAVVRYLQRQGQLYEISTDATINYALVR